MVQSIAAKMLAQLGDKGAGSCKLSPSNASPSWDRLILDAQQSYRFLLRLEDVDVALISEVGRPGYTISTSEHRLLNWHFHFPETIKWQEISFTVRELYSASTANLFIQKLRACAYDYPDQISSVNIKDLSKHGLVNSLGKVVIQMLKPDSSVHEQWILHGAFIKAVKFSDLNYNSDDLTNIKVTVSYDWAELELGANVNSSGANE